MSLFPSSKEKRLKEIQNMPMDNPMPADDNILGVVEDLSNVINKINEHHEKRIDKLTDVVRSLSALVASLSTAVKMNSQIIQMLVDDQKGNLDDGK